MKLYDGGRAPNPRRVDIFLREKGVEVERVPVDMGELGHKSPEITALNPLQRLPILELDDGAVICESVAICRYFEELYPEPNLLGENALERAVVEMWQRRCELTYLASVAAAFRHVHPAMKEWEVPQIPEWGEVNKPKALEFLKLMDQELAGRDYVAGDRFTIADITMVVGFDFMKPARIVCPPELENVWAWHARVSARPSVSAK